MNHHKATQAKAINGTDKHRAAVKTAVDGINKTIASVPGLVTMTITERKRVLKMHTGGERYIEQMANLAVSDASVCPQGVDPKTMLAQLSVDADLATLENALKTALQQVQDARLLATGSAWHDALDIYALSQTRARREPSKHDQVAAMQQFLSTGPHHAKPAAPTPTS
ncbi:MAG TPA: hypothetical protein VGH28_03470 [Polyangiaceae bacterium]|jgi:hypothetical protein